MLLNLTDLSSEPLQQQIIRLIRAKILTGEMVAGSGLPSIRALSRVNHVSVITVQRAYEMLVRDELIHSRRGKGFFVSDLPQNRKNEIANDRIHDNLEPIILSALADGLSADDILGIVGNIIKNRDTDSDDNK